MPALDLIQPGDPSTLTGGYLYNRRLLEVLAARGWATTVHRLDTSFPTPTPAALEQAREVLAAIPAQRLVLVDGLALGGMPELIERLAKAPLPKDLTLNVNVPDIPYASLTGVRSTRLGFRHKSESIIREKDPYGRTIYWVGPAGRGQDAGPGTETQPWHRCPGMPGWAGSAQR